MDLVMQRILLVCLVCSAWGVGPSGAELDVPATSIGRHPLQAGSNCDPGSEHPNACFNADGSRFICCGPESCPSVPGSDPQCAGTTESQGCDGHLRTPNPCYDADGTGFTCCPGACSTVNNPVAFCAFEEGTPSEDSLVEVFFIITVENYTLADLTQEMRDAYVAAFKSLPDVVDVELLEVTAGSLRFKTRLRVFSRSLKAVIRVATKIVEPVFRVATSIVVSLIDLIDPGIPPSPICIDDCPYRNNAGQLLCKGDCFGGSEVCPTYPSDIFNGCGASGSGEIVTFIVNIPRYLSLALDAFQNACNHHDVCYGTPGRSQFECDRELQLRLQGGCAATYPFLLLPQLRTDCLLWAYVTSTAVRVGGTPAHTAGQRATEHFAETNCASGPRAHRCVGSEIEKGVAVIGFSPDIITTRSKVDCGDSYVCIDDYASITQRIVAGMGSNEGFNGTLYEFYSSKFVGLQNGFVGVFEERLHKICRGETTEQPFGPQILEVFCGCLFGS